MYMYVVLVGVIFINVLFIFIPVYFVSVHLLIFFSFYPKVALKKIALRNKEFREKVILHWMLEHLPKLQHSGKTSGGRWFPSLHVWGKFCVILEIVMRIMSPAGKRTMFKRGSGMSKNFSKPLYKRQKTNRYPSLSLHLKVLNHFVNLLPWWMKLFSTESVFVHFQFLLAQRIRLANTYLFACIIMKVWLFTSFKLNFASWDFLWATWR